MKGFALTTVAAFAALASASPAHAAEPDEKPANAKAPRYAQPLPTNTPFSSSAVIHRGGEVVHSTGQIIHRAAK